MLSLCRLWINNKHYDILNTILSLEAKKGSQMVEKEYSVCTVCMVCTVCSLQYAWSTFWGDRYDGGFVWLKLPFLPDKKFAVSSWARACLETRAWTRPARFTCTKLKRTLGQELSERKMAVIDPGVLSQRG